MEPRPQRLLTISQAAARLGVHPDTLRAWADKGLVPVIKLPSGVRRFEPQEIERVRAEMGLKVSSEVRMSLPNGRRMSLYGKTRKQVQKKLKDAQRDLDKGIDLSASGQRVSVFLTTWLESVVQPNKA